MNSIPKSGNGPPGRKKPGRPKNNETENMNIKNSLPPVPNLNEILPLSKSPVVPKDTTSPKPQIIRSPIDQTPIVVNGKVVDLDSMIEERVNNASPVIEPITPPKINSNKEYIEEQSNTPTSFPIPDVNILETPKREISEESESEFYEETEVSKIPETSIIQSIVSSESEKTLMFPINQEKLSVIQEESQVPKPHILPPPSFKRENIKVETLPNKPLNFTSIITNTSTPSSTTSYTDSLSPKSEGSVVQDFVKKEERKIDPFEVSKVLNLVSSAQSDNGSEDYEDEEYEESETENLLPNIEIEDEEKKDPVITLPAISGRFRADSPIETIGGPSSPPMRSINQNGVKPMFNPDGKSYTPRRVVSSPVVQAAPQKTINKIVEDNSVPILSNMIQPSPRPGSRIPSPVRPGSKPISPRNYSPRQQFQQPQQGHIQGPEMFFPPQNRDSSSMFGGRPDYSKLTLEQQVYMKSQFKAKFGILRSSYPEWNIQDPDERLSLDQIHDIYEYYIRQIMVSKETGQYKVYLVIFFMFVEVIGVKLLKLNMSGYTMSQLKIMNRYDSLLAELGEKWLISSGSDWPIEARLLMMAVFNAIVFIAVRYLCSWMGVDGLSDTIQGFIDSMLNGPSDSTNHFGRHIPNAQRPPTPVPGRMDQSSGNPLDGIASAFSGLFGGNNNASNGAAPGGAANNGFAEGIAKLGTMFTKNMQNNNKTASTTQAAKPSIAKPSIAKSNTKGRIDKKTLFG
jgi:hypothetical protein